MTEAILMAALPPTLLADLERELARVDGLLDRCAGRLSAMAIMAGFPDAGDDGPSAALPSPRLPQPPLPRRNLPPED